MTSHRREASPSRYVFLNCPFDSEYQPIFRAIVFTVVDFGFVCKCAMEESDSGKVRIDKIAGLISRSRYGIHDLSRAGADKSSGFARMNMPFELGLFLGAKFFGDPTSRKKACLILEAERYNYQKFLSDIAGQDTEAHGNDPAKAIRIVGKWLRSSSRRRDLPGEERTIRRFRAFGTDLPGLVTRLDLNLEDLTFLDYVHIVEDWLRALDQNA